jgi:hypothetical protein
MQSWPDGEPPKSMVRVKQKISRIIAQLDTFSLTTTGTKFYPQLLLSTKVALVKLNQCRRALKEIGRFITDQSICAGGSKSDACAVSSSSTQLDSFPKRFTVLIKRDKIRTFIPG